MNQIIGQNEIGADSVRSQKSGNFGNDILASKIDDAKTDSRIKYPSYKSFDEFFDVERLKSLDQYITNKIKERIAAKNEEYFLNAYRLEADSPHQPGAREIWLSRPKAVQPSVYDELDNTELWEPTEDAKNFSLLTDFIETLPFKAKGRILIIYDDAPRSVPAHRDHLNTDVCHEFIWFRTKLNKPFYMLNHKTGEKKYVESYSAWFDSVNQYHGVDPYDGFSFSFRVDGVFTDEFRKLIPKPAFNRASTPSLWAALES
jgi:hypothetical protein